MLGDRRARVEVGAALAVAVAVRLPFWNQACRTPVDADTAIVGLMARHGGWSATLWGQPYGSPLEAWLAIPLVAILGPRALPLRLLYFALGLALVPLAYFLAGQLDRRAALPAALLVACPPAYLLLLSSLPPPLYPAALVLCGLLLVLALELRARLLAGERAILLALGWGALAGLALWTHLMCISAVLPGLLALAPALRRSRPALAALAASALAAVAPLVAGVFLHGGVLYVVRLSHPRLGWQEHFLGLLRDLHRPLGALLGAAVPALADLRTRIEAPAWVALALALLWIALGARGAARLRGGVAGRVVLGAAGLALLVFLLPLRSATHTVRFLTPLYLPLAAVAGAAAARAPWARAAVAALAALNLVGAGQLLHAWEGADRALRPFLIPDLAPVRRFLQERGLNRAYAAYEPAYRLTWESDEELIVSQPWNERFPSYPVPYFDAVRRASHVAWVLVPGIPSELPAPEALEAELRRIGAEWRRAEVGPAIVYYDLAPLPAGAERAPAAGPGFALRWVNQQPEPSWRGRPRRFEARRERQ